MSKKTITDEFNEPDEPKKFSTISAAEQFDRQPTPSRFLPDPHKFTLNVTHRTLEVLAGSRDVNQIARWVTEEVYQSLAERVNQQRRKKSLLPAEQSNRQAPVFALVRSRMTSPRDGVVESAVIVRTPHRLRAVALRLEGFDRRWRAAAFTLI